MVGKEVWALQERERRLRLKQADVGRRLGLLEVSEAIPTGGQPKPSRSTRMRGKLALLNVKEGTKMGVLTSALGSQSLDHACTRLEFRPWDRS